MKTIYPHIHFRPFGFAYEDLPAFHAAYFMLILIFAGIFDLGFFALLIIAHLIFDTITFVRSPKNRRVNVFFADIALFFLALSSIVYLNPQLPVVATLTGSHLTHVIILRGLAVLLPKLTILHHSLRILFNVPAYLQTPYQNRRIWSFAECVYLSTLFLSLCFLAVAPGVLALDLATFKDMLTDALIPWKF
jgi:hypothetical protein